MSADDGCLYCFKRVAEYVDPEGDPICEECSEPVVSNA